MTKFSCVVVSVLLLMLLFLLQTISSTSPVRKLIANVRGKQYHIEAESVSEFSQKLEKLVGLHKSQQNILYRGKRLRKSDRFDQLDIHDGDVLNVLKGRAGGNSLSQAKATRNHFGVPSALPRKSQGKVKSSTLDSKSLDPGAMFGGIGTNDMKATMEQINSMIDSDFFDKLFANEEQLEMTRQQLLANIDKYESVMPGFKKSYEEIASDPQKWKLAMIEAKEQISRIRQQQNIHGKTSKHRHGNSQDRGR